MRSGRQGYLSCIPRVCGGESWMVGWICCNCSYPPRIRGRARNPITLKTSVENSPYLGTYVTDGTTLYTVIGIILLLIYEGKSFNTK